MIWWRCLVSPVRLSDIFSQHPQCETAGWGHLFGEQLCVTDRGVLWAWQSSRALPSSVLIDCNLVSTHLSNALCGWKYWNLWEHPNRYHSQNHIAQRYWRNRASVSWIWFQRAEEMNKWYIEALCYYVTDVCNNELTYCNVRHTEVTPTRGLDLFYLNWSDFTYLSCVCDSQGLYNIIHLDFDYKKEFIYWVDSTRPSGRKINRMRLNGSDLKVPRTSGADCVPRSAS